MAVLRKTLPILIVFLATAQALAIRTEDIDADDYKNLLKRYPQLQETAPPLSVLDLAIQQLMSLDTYAKASVQRTQSGELLLKGEPLKRVSEIQINGNKVFDDDEITMALGLKLGGKFDSGRLLEAGERLKEFYGRAGYLNAIISFNFEEINKSDLRVLIKVRERNPCLITGVEIQSENQNLKSRLEKRAKKILKEHFTEESVTELEQLLNEYLKSQRYLNTRLIQRDAIYNSAKTQVRLIYDLNDPYSYEFILRGQKSYSSAKILKEVKPEELPLGSADLGQDVTEKIRSFYIASGFPNMRAQYNEKIIKKFFTKHINIDIEEGYRVKISSLDVVGRISKPAKYYSDFIIENSSDMIQDGYLVRNDLENGLKNLTTHLNNQGYIRAKIQSSRIEYNNKKDAATVTIVLDEGPLTQLQHIEFQGVRSFSTQQLIKIIPIKPGTALRLNELEGSVAAIQKFYAERGFIEMRVLNNDETLVQYDERNLSAKVVIRIEEGPQVFIKAVLLDGNSFTKDYVILREAGLEIGDLVTPDLLDETKKRLDKLAIFSRVEIKTLEANTDASQRTLLISVSERNPGLLKFGAGITNKRELTARGYSSLSYNNIGGTARAVSLRATLENNLVQENYLEYEVSVAYLEPFLFDKRLRGRASYSRSEQIIEPTTNDEKVSATDKIKFTLEKDLTSQIKLSWLAWGFDSVEQFDLPTSGPLRRESRQEIAYVGPTLDIDYRDDFTNPTVGTFTRWDAEYAAPELGSSDKIQFVRTQGGFTHYQPFRKNRVVWANSFRAGYEKNLSTLDGSGIPYSFSFFLGGYSTVRGYSGFGNDRIPSESEFSIRNRTDQLVIPGESTYGLVKSELRFPIWQDPFGAVVFYDAGQVNIQGYTFEKPFRQSYGVGIRINTPVGPLSLDYARKIAPLDSEDNDHWHLSIGTF